MAKHTPIQLLLFTIVTLSGISCANNNAATPAASTRNSIHTKTESKHVTAERKPTPAAAEAATIDCGRLLTAAMVEDACGRSGVVERISSVERKGSNCNRLYGVGKNAWGDELVFIVTVFKDATGAASGFNRIKKDNTANGPAAAGNIGDEAFTLNFKDPLNKRENRQLVFRKKGYLIELKTNESRSVKTPCPCFETEKLKILAAKIADNL